MLPAVCDSCVAAFFFFQTDNCSKFDSELIIQKSEKAQKNISVAATDITERRFGDTEEQKPKRGRPKIDTHITDRQYDSRRNVINKKYMFDGYGLLLDAGDSIPDSKLIFNIDCPKEEHVSKDGIMEQLGRMYEQDKVPLDECTCVANLAIAAVKAGIKSKCIEKAIREIRMTRKPYIGDPDNETLENRFVSAITQLHRMGKS